MTLPVFFCHVFRVLISVLVCFVYFCRVYFHICPQLLEAKLADPPGSAPGPHWGVCINLSPTSKFLATPLIASVPGRMATTTMYSYEIVNMHPSYLTQYTC